MDSKQAKRLKVMLICPQLLTFTTPGTVCHYVVISVEVFDCSACVELYSLLYVCICLSAGGLNIKKQVIESY